MDISLLPYITDEDVILEYRLAFCTFFTVYFLQLIMSFEFDKFHWINNIISNEKTYFF